jgi:hypothetical protein
MTTRNISLEASNMDEERFKRIYEARKLKARESSHGKGRLERGSPCGRLL